ncbi:sensor histidine kinase [Aquimarina muelleri]|uniref:sensor histidine kinase n=1 Tax=Aquimarina muelleri TaxID=279356 RepID=UPI0012DEA8B3|nr:sensor histidine kinase [Aquimarina muelleri]MCX2764433.1 sensor histidine kinase [Aquimarina muelleri]
MIKKILFIFSIYYLPILGLSSLIVKLAYDKQYSNLDTLQKKDLYYKKKLVKELLNPIIANVFYWSNYNFSENDFDPKMNGGLGKEFGDFLIGMSNYSQFRLIDNMGQEVFRLNRSEKGNVLREAILQDKSYSKYFQNTNQLKKGQIYLSPLNLNVENNILEIPYSPTIRGSAPIFDSENKRLGIVIINFNAQKLLEILKNDDDYSFTLIDNKGNYLATKDKKKDFSHIIPNQEKSNFASMHPKVWNILKKETDTSFVKDKDLWVKIQFNFKVELANLPVFQYKNSDIETSNNWLLINQIPYELIQKKLNKLLFAVLVFNILVIIFLFCFVLLRLKSKKAKKEYLRELKSINKKLEIRNYQLKGYNNMVAHNLRAPATSISALISILVSSTTYDEAKVLFPKLTTVTSNINLLVDDLFTYVEILNNDKPKIERLDLNEIVNSVLNIHKDTLLSNSIHVTQEFVEWNEVQFSRDYLKIVLQNLISNAIKYRNLKNNSYIYIRSSFKNNKKIITIKDNGLGINLNRYNHEIFKFHKRFHKGVSGRGMGLFITKTILESLGARIEVESKINEGTIFTIIF